MVNSCYHLTIKQLLISNHVRCIIIRAVQSNLINPAKLSVLKEISVRIIANIDVLCVILQTG